MKKKWNEMSLEEKKEWHKDHPWVMRSYKIIFGLAGLLILIAIFAPSSKPSEVPVHQLTQAEFDSLPYDKQDSLCREWANTNLQIQAKRMVEEKCLDADADADMPDRVIVLIADEGYCRFAGQVIAKNAFGVKMKKQYNVDFHLRVDSVLWDKVEIW